MAVPIEESDVTYQQLSDLERAFEDVETEIIRQQVRLTKPLFEKRQQLISRIPGFWPLVIEEAPVDIDTYIQPSDSTVLLSSLTSFSVTRFEAEDVDGGDPRSVAFRWEFAENEYFEDRVIEKKFWWRRSRTDKWSGFVSEPIDIKWRKGKDLTNGLLGLAKALWDTEQAKGASEGELKAKKKALREKINGLGLGDVSFFAWFGFRGRNVSAEESKIATREEKERRQRRANGEEVSSPSNDETTADGDEEPEDLEIFPDGAELAMALADDLWTEAIKYFCEAQQNDDEMSDVDYESGQGGEDDDQSGSDRSERPAKKRKA